MKNTRIVTVLLIFFCLSCSRTVNIPITPDQISKGLHVGAAALPYYVYSNISLQEINNIMISMNATVTIEGTYLNGYGKPFIDIPKNGDTGQVFKDLQTASMYFQEILAGKGVKNADNYYITGIGTAMPDGLILMAVVYRPKGTITTFNKYNFLAKHTLTAKDPEFFRPYKMTDKGEKLDTVYEWAAIPVDCFIKQGDQAILLTLAANTTLKQKEKKDYWKIERHWIAGDHLSIIIEQDIKICQTLGIEEGFTQKQKIFRQ